MARSSLQQGRSGPLSPSLSILRSLTRRVVCHSTVLRHNSWSRCRYCSSSTSSLPTEVVDRIAEHFYDLRDAQRGFSASLYQPTRLLLQEFWRWELVKGELIPRLSDLTSKAFSDEKEHYGYEMTTLGLIKMSAIREGTLLDWSAHKLNDLRDLDGPYK